MRLNGFLGNSQAVGTLSAQIDSDKPANLLILVGEDGTGKKTLADIIATALVCSGDGEKPCGVCPNCKKAAVNSHPDIIHIISENKSGSISAKQAREIIEKAYVMPNEAERMVFIIHHAELMDVISQNILLKVFEEPPLTVHFILLCSDINKLLPTVISRGVTVRLSGIEASAATAEVARRLPDASDEDIKAAESVADGNIGRMLSLLQDASFAENIAFAGKVASAALRPDGYELLTLMSETVKDKDRFENLLSLLQIIYKDALLIAEGAEISPMSDASAEVASRLIPSRIAELYRITADTALSSKYNPNRTLQQTYFCSRLMS